MSVPISHIELAGVRFFEAPSGVEGSPYWVDLWDQSMATELGYR